MMKSVLGLLLFTLTAPAWSQMAYPGSPAFTDALFAQSAQDLAESYAAPAGMLDSPAQRARRLNEALALRDEYWRLADDDGGKLTPEHLKYVRAKARQILSR